MIKIDSEGRIFEKWTFDPCNKNTRLKIRIWVQIGKLKYGW